MGKREIIEKIKSARYGVAILESRGHFGSYYNDELDKLWEKYPTEYGVAEKEIYKKIK